jgi:hypothetical protein
MTVALTSTQILIVGLLAMFLTWFLSLLIEKAIPWFLAVTKIRIGVKIDLGRFVKTLLVGTSAFLLAWWWYPAVLPALPVFVPPFGNEFDQFVAWVPILLASLTPYIGAAMTVYNLLLGYLLDPEKRKQILLTLMKLLFPGGLPIPPAPPNL